MGRKWVRMKSVVKRINSCINPGLSSKGSEVVERGSYFHFQCWNR